MKPIILRTTPYNTSMPTLRAGPELPPHLLAKRKRQAETSATPEPQLSDKANQSRSSSPDSASKRRRVIGPAPPPAPLNERPQGNPGQEHEDSDEEDDDEDDDDDFGPSLPSSMPITSDQPTTRYSLDNMETKKADEKARRDDWMTMPPKQDDLAARLDPTKQRARGFNTGKGAKGPSQASGGDNAIWTETPEQKRKRLEDEILGVSQPVENGKAGQKTSKSQAEDEEKARKINEYNEKHRSRSLYEQHIGAAKKEKEDDPSKRGFDYEKDMAIGAKIGQAQKRELLNKAADFGSRFSKGSYL